MPIAPRRRLLPLLTASALLSLVAACAVSDDLDEGGAGGAGGNAGASGSAGSGGTAGTAGTSGGAGTAGTAGSAGTAGTAGLGGMGGTGTGGTSGSAGTSGTGGSGGGPTGTGLIFSEYVEDGTTKVLEIYNASSSTIDLTTCQLERYANGSTSGQEAQWGGSIMIAPGQAVALCQTNGPGCDEVNAVIAHSGDDGYVLTCGAQIQDTFGQLGDASVWGSGNTSSDSNTLRRDCSIGIGDTNFNDPFDPATEWTGLGTIDTSDLGKHCQ